MKLRAAAIVLSAALCSAGLAGGAAADETITLVERAAGDTVTDLGAKGDSAGDILTFANEIYDKANAKKAGSDNGWCARTVVGKAWECIWTTTLAEGQITVEGPFYDTADLRARDHRRHRRVCRSQRLPGAARPQRQGHRVRLRLQAEVAAARRLTSSA